MVTASIRKVIFMGPLKIMAYLWLLLHVTVGLDLWE